jgi:L-threonylcarbamoyladenylate synthase
MVTVARVVTADMEGLVAAAKVVDEGGIIGYPTDTVYGLGCNPFNARAIEKVIKVKGNRAKPLPVLAKTVGDAEKVVDFSEAAIKLAKHYWPGPLTIVLRARDTVPVILAPEKTVGVRAPNHTICLSLLGLCSGLLVGTSANKTGAPAATTATQVITQLGDQIDLVIDGGKTTLGLASTVVDARQNIAVIREGPISEQDLLECLHSLR